MTTQLTTIDSKDLDGVTGGFEVPQWAKDAAGKVGELFGGFTSNVNVNSTGPVVQGNNNKTKAK